MLISRAIAATPELPAVDAASPELLYVLLAIVAVPLIGWAVYHFARRGRRSSVS